MVRRDDAAIGDAGALIRGFAAATNLLIAGRTFAIAGDGPLAESLRTILLRLGARYVGGPVRDAPAPDYLFVTDRAGAAALLRSLARTEHADADEAVGAKRRAVNRPTLVIDVTEDGILDPAAWAEAPHARPGVRSVRVDGTPVLVVRPVAAGSHDGSGPGAEAADAVHNAELRIAWARRFMPVSLSVARELASASRVAGIRVGISMVLEPKTANLALFLRDAGAIVSVYAHPAETDDAVAECLRRAGIPVDARSDADADEAHRMALAFLDRSPQILLDDGSHLIRLAHKERPELLSQVIGAAEETTSGLRPLRDLQKAGALRIPVIAVNDARTKTLFDNRYGTGQSCVFTILDLLARLPAATEAAARAGSARRIGGDLRGKVVAVAGFGPVGEGVARTAAALGADVVVAESDPVRALEAVFSGYRSAPLIDAVSEAELVISATGIRDTIALSVLLACADGAAVAVAGGVDQEVAIDHAVQAGAVRRAVAAKVESFDLPGGRRVLILDDGGCINVTAGEGNPVEIMDLSFAVQLSAARILVDSTLPGARRLEPGVVPVESGTDARIAQIALRHFTDGVGNAVGDSDADRKGSTA